MNEERRHERELLKTKIETIEEIRKSLVDRMEVAKNLGIDLTDKEQTAKYFESKSVRKLIEAELFIRRMKMQQEARRKILAKMQLANYESELSNIKKKCDRFPKCLRIRLHKTKIDELSKKIEDYSNNRNIAEFPKTQFDTAIANLERSMDTMYMSFRLGNILTISPQLLKMELEEDE